MDNGKEEEKIEVITIKERLVIAEKNLEKCESEINILKQRLNQYETNQSCYCNNYSKSFCQWGRSCKWRNNNNIYKCIRSNMIQVIQCIICLLIVLVLSKKIIKLLYHEILSLRCR